MGKLKIFPKTGDLESVTRLPSRGSRVTVDLLLMDVKSFNPPIDRMKSHVKLLSQWMKNHIPCFVQMMYAHVRSHASEHQVEDE
jgi:hypothetical protein